MKIRWPRGTDDRFLSSAFLRLCGHFRGRRDIRGRPLSAALPASHGKREGCQPAAVLRRIKFRDCCLRVRRWAPDDHGHLHRTGLESRADYGNTEQFRRVHGSAERLWTMGRYRETCRICRYRCGSGAAANVVYRGRSGCCVGEDQIAFCVPAYKTYPAGVTDAAQPRGAYVQFIRALYPPATFAGAPTSSDFGVARFVQLGETISSFNIALDGPPFDSCLVASSVGTGAPPILNRLDAGATLANAGGGLYGGQIGNGTASFQISSFTWTNQPASNVVPVIARASGTTVKWSGRDPNGYVQISGCATSSNNVTMGFVCTAHTADGTFTGPVMGAAGAPRCDAGGAHGIEQPGGNAVVRDWAGRRHCADSVEFGELRDLPVG